MPRLNKGFDAGKERTRLALLRAYQRDAKDYALYAKRAQTDRMKRYWLHAEATVLRQIERLEKKGD